MNTVFNILSLVWTEIAKGGKILLWNTNTETHIAPNQWSVGQKFCSADLRRNAHEATYPNTQATAPSVNDGLKSACWFSVHLVLLGVSEF